VKQSKKEGVSNVDFKNVDVQHLPFQEDCFDLVVSRLGFHHFVEPYKILSEMDRVCKPGGTIEIVDMISPEENQLFRLYNHYERLRDPSHVNALKESNFIELFKYFELKIKHNDIQNAPFNLRRWLELTKTDNQIRKKLLMIWLTPKNEEVL